MNKTKLLKKVHEICADGTCEGKYPCDKFKEFSKMVDQLIDSVPEDPIKCIRTRMNDFDKGWNGMCNNNHNWKIEAKK